MDTFFRFFLGKGTLSLVKCGLLKWPHFEVARPQRHRVFNQKSLLLAKKSVSFNPDFRLLGTAVGAGHRSTLKELA